MSPHDTRPIFQITPSAWSKETYYGFKILLLLAALVGGFLCLGLVLVFRDPVPAVAIVATAGTAFMAWVVWRNYANSRSSRYLFYRTHLVAEEMVTKGLTVRSRLQKRELPYDKIAHVEVSPDGRTLTLRYGMGNWSTSESVIITVPPEEGNGLLGQVVSTMRRAAPDHLFSYHDGQRRYSRAWRVDDLFPDRQVRVQLQLDSIRFAEWQVTADRERSPAVIIRQEYTGHTWMPYNYNVLSGPPGPVQRWQASDGSARRLLYLHTASIHRTRRGWQSLVLRTRTGMEAAAIHIKFRPLGPLIKVELGANQHLSLEGNLSRTNYDVEDNGKPIGLVHSPSFSEVRTFKPGGSAISLGLGLIVLLSVVASERSTSN